MIIETMRVSNDSPIEGCIKMADSSARSMVRKVLANRKLEGLLCLRSFHYPFQRNREGESGWRKRGTVVSPSSPKHPLSIALDP